MITVFTPTYNRRELLKKLKISLDNQKCFEFIWLIVDDGSTDHTEELVRKWINSDIKYQIIYLKQDNAGKYTAYNKALSIANTKYFCCVDSDDMLSDDAVLEILRAMKSIDAVPEIIGRAFPMNLSYDFNIWKKIENKQLDIIDFKELYGIRETFFVFKTHVISKYRFPVYYDSNGNQFKFESEGLLFNQLTKSGKLMCCNHIVYLAEYQDNGLTQKLFSHTWSENGIPVIEDFRLRYSVAKKYSFLKKWEVRIKASITIDAVCLNFGYRFIEKAPNKFLGILCIVPAIIYKYQRFDKKHQC